MTWAGGDFLREPPRAVTIAIVGYGWVGKSMHAIFPDAALYDVTPGQWNSREAVNACDIAFVCVPTPARPTGACDLSMIEDVISWLDVPIICLKSAVPPGTTNRLRAETGKQIVVSPEFIGEGPTWDGTIADTFACEYPDRAEQARRWPYVIAGGPKEASDAVLNAFEERLGSGVEYIWEENPTTVELVKYMENVWLAMQVTFANTFYEVARVLGADYADARDLWCYDMRVSASHTDVLAERGFGGKCLPKDLDAIIAASDAAGYSPEFLRAIRRANAMFRKMNHA